MSTYPDQVHLFTMTASDEPRHHALIRPKWIWDHKSDLIPLDHLQIVAQWNTYETWRLMVRKSVLLRSLLSPRLCCINYTIDWELNLKKEKKNPSATTEGSRELIALVIFSDCFHMQIK